MPEDNRYPATDCPGEEDRQYTIVFKQGKFTRVEVDVQPAPSKLREPSFDKGSFDYKAIGDHKRFFELLSGEIDLIEWIKHTRIEGDFGKPLTQLAGLTKFLEVLSTMDLEL